MSGMVDMDGWMRDVADAAASLDKRGDRQMSARLMRLHRDMDIARLRGDAEEEANEIAAIAAYEKHMGVSADDPAYGPDLAQWMAGWNAALSSTAAPAPVAGEAVAKLPAKWREDMPSREEQYGDRSCSGEAAGYDACIYDLEAALAQDRASQGAAGVPDEWRDLVQSLVTHIEYETCMHENTHRGGAIWEICDDCGRQWADDRGGRPAFKWPEPVERAHAMLAAAPVAPEREG